jgi:hypothetical protein
MEPGPAADEDGAAEADAAAAGLPQELREDVEEAPYVYLLGETELLDAASRSENQLFMALPSDRLLEAEQGSRRRGRSKKRQQALPVREAAGAQPAKENSVDPSDEGEFVL